MASMRAEHFLYFCVVVDFLYIVTPIVGICNCSMFCCTLLYVHSSIAIILMGKRELIAFLNLSSWCLVMVKRLFLAMPRGCLQFVIVVVPDHTPLLFFMEKPGIEPAPGLQCKCLFPIQKTGKTQVNYIQVLVTTPNMEKPQKVFSFFSFLKLFCGFSMGRNQYWAGRVYDLCVFSI